MGELEAAPGVFGKVSTLGDFVTRRLPPGFTAVWDAWLQACMQGSRAQLGASWLDTYLSSPIWRFALAPGVCDANAWAGLMMPSVDRVGRHFPLTLAVGVAGDVPLQAWLVEAKPWFDQLEDLALSSLEAHFAFEQLDAALQAMAPLPPALAPSAPGPFGVHLPIEGSGALDAAIPAVTAAALYGQGLWWTDGSARVAPCMLLQRGLPTPPAFAAMLAGAA
ncbi:MAG: type VI secretion system-associated protein TagF [Pseudomonadota bacterium]